MSTKLWRMLVVLPWLTLPIFVLGYLQVWPHLPSEMVVHFGLSSEPNGWMGRGTFGVFAIGLITFELLIFTWLLLSRRRAIADEFLLVAYYMVIAGEISIFWLIAKFNTSGTPINWRLAGAATLAGGLVPFVIMLLTGQLSSSEEPRRTANMRTYGDVIAEEIHRSKRLFYLNLPFFLIPIAVWLMVPNIAVRVVLIIATLFAAYFTVMIWSGFHYLFTKSGVAVVGLGRTLKFIPVTAI
ncbi:MAG: DUF1648 domain-containing protein, partial [Pyrinomonadaceae bacterium]